MGTTVAVREYGRLLDLPWDSGVHRTEIGPDTDAAEVAAQLRAFGLPAQAYRLASRDLASLEFPFLTELDGRWTALSGREDPAFARLHASEGNGPNATRQGSMPTVIGEPPVGVRFSVVSSRTQRPEGEIPDVAAFYGSTNDPSALAEEQFCPDADALIAQAHAEGRRVVFIDALGLIPEATVSARVSARQNRQQAFAAAFGQIAAETTQLEKGGLGPFETQSPLWQAAYRFLKDRKIRGVLERLRFDLWEEIVAFDRRNLVCHAMDHFAAGLVDDAADLMAQHVQGFHELNCGIRNAYLVEQLKAIRGETHVPPLLLILKEIGHYGVLESLLADSLHVQSKILGHERFTSLARTAGMESVLGNLGVRLSEDELRVQALRSCLKRLVVPTWSPTKSLRSHARLLETSGIDHMSETAVREVIGALHGPCRKYLRNAPHGQMLGKQLLYLLRERGVLPVNAVVDPVTALSFGGEKSAGTSA